MLAQGARSHAAAPAVAPATAVRIMVIAGLRVPEHVLPVCRATGGGSYEPDRGRRGEREGPAVRWLLALVRQVGPEAWAADAT
ncbi:hypothetical protein GCM10023203_10650 [Actinomycetospora straminea]|uniref:Uncharacterized protein n=1 Tax=Actinomycetospora straminea TaxID=663607 RepID=A0ABP9E3H5_9PSEU